MDLEKDDQKELENLTMLNTLEGFFQGEGMKEKIEKLFSVLALPAYQKIVSMLGDDEFRYMMYHDKEYGLIVHKIRTSTSEISFEDPEKGDIIIINKNDIKDISLVLKKFLLK